MEWFSGIWLIVESRKYFLICTNFREPFEKEFRRPIKSHTKVKTHVEAGNRPEIREDLNDGIATLIKHCWINESEVDRRPTMEKVFERLEILMST